jgi:hypothetical protein
MATWKYWKEEGYVQEYENGKMEDLNQSLKKHGINNNIRKKIMKSGELIKKTSKKEVIAEWFYNAMNIMDELLDEKTKKKVREDCACLVMNGKRYEMCKAIKKKYATPEERIEAINYGHLVFGHEIKIIGPGKYEVVFKDESIPEKHCCDCLQVVMDKKMTNTYCYCCGSHVEHQLETLLGKKVDVEILTSSLTSMGEKSCRFVLTEIS